MNQQAQPSTRLRWLIDIILLSIFFLLFYTAWLGSYPLFTPDEGRYGEVAREMLTSGDYITPRVNGVAFLDKPVLYYWLQALSLYYFGVKEWALRLFPVLFALLGTLITYLAGYILYDRRTAILSSLVLTTTPLYFIGAHYANLDLEVAVFISCALLLTLIALEKPTLRISAILLAYGFAGLAMLTKGLIGLILPVAITGVWMIMTNNWRLLPTLHLVKGILIIAAVNLPWYILAQQANPNFFHYFFVVQHFSRFLSQGEFNNSMPLWFYLPIALLGCLPWTWYFIKSIKNGIADHKMLFLWLWITIIIVFFSIPSAKIVTYILPIYPAIALLTANYLNQRWGKPLKRAILSLTSVSCFVMIILVLNAHYFNTQSAKPLALYLKSKAEPHDIISGYFAFHQDVPLYLGQTIQLTANWNDPTIPERDNWMRELWFAMPYQDTSQQLISEERFWQQWRSDQRVYTLLNDNYFEQFKANAPYYYIVMKQGDIFLLSNQIG